MDSMQMRQMHGCLVDTATGDVMDAGLITLAESGHILVSHGDLDGMGEWVSPYLPNPNRAVLAVPKILPN